MLICLSAMTCMYLKSISDDLCALPPKHRQKVASNNGGGGDYNNAVKCLIIECDNAVYDCSSINIGDMIFVYQYYRY